MAMSVMFLTALFERHTTEGFSLLGAVYIFIFSQDGIVQFSKLENFNHEEYRQRNNLHIVLLFL